MKGLLCYPEMLDNSDAPRVLTNSNVGHLIAYQVHVFFFSMYGLSAFLILLMWMQDVLFQTSGVVFPLTNYTSFPPPPLCQGHRCLCNKHIKKVGRVHLVQAGQVKHECNCFQMWHRSLVWGVCVSVYVKMNAPESTHFLYKFSACSLSFLGTLDYIVKITPPRLSILFIILGPQGI